MENANTKLLTIIIVLTIILGFVSFDHSIAKQTTIEKPQQSNTQNTTDITNWNINTNWTYDQNIWINYSADNYIRLNESITYEVSNIGDHTYNGSTYYSYNLTLDGSIIDGYGVMDGYDINIDGGSISGYMLCKVSDQGVIVDYQHRNMNGEAEIYSGVWVDFDAEVNSTRYYHKVVETYDFPMKTNETFWGNTTIETFGDYHYSASDGSYTDSDSVHNYSQINQTNEIAPGLKQIEVPYGNYSTYEVDNDIEYNNTNDNNHIKNWYNETISSYVKQTADLTSGTSDIFWTRKLSEYHENKSDNTCNIDPKTQRVSNETVISGKFDKFDNTNLTIYIPSSSGRKIWTTKTNSNGFYNLTITVPLAPDNTPTNNDFSSVGIIVKTEDYPHIFTISTLTILPDKIKPRISDLTGTNATTGDNFSFKANVTDNIDMVKYVKVEYWYEGSGSTTESLNKSIFDGYWKKEITLSSKYNTLNYRFIASDEFNNVNQSDAFSRDIVDNDPPELIDKTADHAVPGINFTFKVSASDNIDLDEVYVEYSGQEIGTNNRTMDNVEFESYEREVYIEPGPNSITYKLSARDINGNWVSLDIKEIPVEDTLSPVADAGKDITVNATKLIHLSGENSTDNVGIVNYTWDVDGNTFHGESINLTYEELGYHYAELIVKDAAGNSDSDSINITVVDEIDPVAAAGDDKTVDEDTRVHFNGSLSTDNTDIVSYTWKIEEKVLNGKEINYTFSTPGDYKVVLKVTDLGGNYDEDIVNVTVKDITEPVIRVDYDDPANEDTVVTFNASDSHDNYKIDEIVWKIEGEQKYGPIIEHTFNDPGEKDIEINISDISGNYNSDTFKIEVKDTTPPEAFCEENITVDIGEDFILNASASEDNHGISTYEWVIEDEVYQGESISYSYEESGEYLIELVVTDLYENSDNCTVRVEVNDLTPPTIIIDNDITVDINEEVNFSAEDVEDNGEISSYVWEIDGKSYEGKTKEYSFDRAGTYSVEHTVTDAGDNSASEVIEVKVEDTENPEAKIDFEKDSRKEFSFDASNSSDNGNIVSYHWDFGDGTTDEGKEVSHKYDESGEYTVTLTVEDGAGNTDEITRTIKVEKKNKGIPGFSLALLLLMITFVTLYKIRKEK